MRLCIEIYNDILKNKKEREIVFSQIPESYSYQSQDNHLLDFIVMIRTSHDELELVILIHTHIDTIKLKK